MPRALVTALMSTLVIATGCADRPRPPTEPTRQELSVAELLGSAPAAGFARAMAPRTFSFPADHGPHPAFRTEWWYFTGNLEAESGRRFGYQLTFFRTALAPAPPQRESSWAVGDTYMAHFAVTDVERGRFHSFERFARGAAGLAGASADPVRVWLEDWSLAGEGSNHDPFRLRAAEEGIALDLELRAAKPPVLQGDRGLSRKGREEGNASYYYSLTRLVSRGRLAIDGDGIAVEGSSWLDREWSTSALEPGQVGWDWFALQLSDGSDLMLYRLRRDDGSTDPSSAGTLVEPDGTLRRLTVDDFQLRILDRWESPAGGSYPSRWRLEVPAHELSLEVRPRLADQELRHTFRYWEGTVGASGSRSGTAISAEGYVELVGYQGHRSKAM